ncbi:MAG: cytochrome P450 [Marinibacterium sp.]|nr:cytochrome P450 [Marinibacterium sp.]
MKPGLGGHPPHDAAHHVMFDDAYRADPYRSYAQLRAEAPVHWDDALKAWVVTRAADISTVLHDADRFLSNRVTLGRARFDDPSLSNLFDTIERIMLQTDGARHDRLRRLVAQAFKRQAIAAYEPGVRALAGRLLDLPAGPGRVEFVHDVAIPLPVLVISDIVGIPASDQAQIKAWCDDFSIVALNFYARISDTQLAAGRDAVAAFSAYMRDLIDQRRRDPRDDLLSGLVHAAEDGGRLSFDELVANALVLLNAGNETTTVLLVNAAHMLASDPGLQSRLRADPDQIPAFVEECLRCFPPVQFIGRLVAQDTDLGGQSLRQGDLVLTFLGAAGRDGDAVPEDPEQFRVDRAQMPHLSFGTGPHVCLGLQLARLEARIAIELLLQRTSGFDLTDEALELGPNLNLRCFRALPLRYRRA